MKHGLAVLELKVPGRRHECILDTKNNEKTFPSVRDTQFVNIWNVPAAYFHSSAFPVFNLMLSLKFLNFFNGNNKYVSSEAHWHILHNSHNEFNICGSEHHAL